MSCLQNELILESLFEEVQEAFPYLSEEKQVEIAEKRSLARCIIKTMKWTNIKGEDEIEHQPNETLNKLK